MGLKGNLAVVNLADVFQMLSRSKSNGLLRVQAPEGTRYIEMQDGKISLAGRSTQYIQLGDLLLSRKAIDFAKLETALKIHKENGMVLGQVLLEMNYVTKADLESTLHFLIEEEVCDLFTLREGEFDFLASASLDTKIAPGGGAVRLEIEPDSMLLEAARRADEWHEIEQRITTQSLLFRMTADGQNIYHDADSISEEGRILMRLLQANNSVEGIVQKSCLGRLNSNRMVLELWDAQLIEAVPKDEYINYCKLQMEAGQYADALRIAVHASKVGAPETIKAAVPLIDSLRKQLAIEEGKPLTPASDSLKIKPLSVSKKSSVQTNLIIKKQKLPWTKIAIGSVILIALGVTGFVYLTQPNERQIANLKLANARVDVNKLLDERNFVDAKKRADAVTTTDADFKKEVDKFKSETVTRIDTQLLTDIADFEKKIPGGVSKADIDDVKSRLKDFDAWVAVNDRSTKARNKIKKMLPIYEVAIYENRAREQLERIRKDLQNQNRTVDELIGAYRDLLKSAPPESIASLARKDLYLLLAPQTENMRMIALAKELMTKGGYESARKILDGIKSRNPGTTFAAEADKNMREIDSREAQAAESISKARRFILQKKDTDARESLEAVLKNNPPRSVIAEALEMRRKLDDEIPEQKLAERVKEAARIADSDPRKARLIILDEIIAKYPWSQAAWSATLRVQITSSPEGATVTLNAGAADKILGVTRESQPLYADLPAMGPFKITYALPGFEPYETVENNLRGEKIEAVFVRKPQEVSLAPIAATAGMAVLGETLLLAGGNELSVCSRKKLDVLRRINLEGLPQPLTVDNKTQQPPALAKGELDLRAMSVSADEAEAFAFLSCSGPYFFQVTTNGTDFYRIPCQPGAVGAPQMYRPQNAAAVKLIGIVTKFDFEIFTDTRKPMLFKKPIPPNTTLGQEQPVGVAFDTDTFFVPRDNNTLYAVEGYRGNIPWQVKFPGAISMPPASTRDGKNLGLLDTKGRLTIFDIRNEGKERARADLDAPSSLGLAAAQDGFLVATDDAGLAYVSSSGGKPVWSLKLPSKALFTPQVQMSSRNTKDAPAAIVCCDALNNSYTVVAIQMTTGNLLWRARLAAKPAAFTVSQDAVYISTVEGELLKFDITITPGSN